MKYLFDTNFFYYYSNLSTSSEYDNSKIEVEINSNLYISELTILELFTHFKNDKSKIIQAAEFILNKNIDVITIREKKVTRIKQQFIDLLKDDTKLPHIISSIVDIRATYESQLLRFMIESLIGVMSLFLINKNPINGIEENNKYVLQLIALIEGNREFMSNEIKLFLMDFYDVKDEKLLKKNLMSISSTLLYTLMNTYILSKNNITISQIPEGPNKLPDDRLEKLFEELHNNQFTIPIFNRIDGDSLDRIIPDKTFWETFDNSINSYISEMEISIPKVIVHYFSVFIRRYFIENTKIRKNDALDSQFLLFYPEYQIISNDTLLCDIIDSYDNEYSKKINEFKQKVKK